MRFLMLAFRRFSSRDKHLHRPARIDSFVPDRVEAAATEDDPVIDALLRELGEDPFDVWARLCAPSLPTEHDPSSRTRRLGKRRVQMRRRVGARD
jgi:hypothetical protein